jgi:hypothetical protein
MHWCSDESLAAASAIPVIGALFRKAHKWYHKKTHHKCHQAGCDAKHLHHIEVEESLVPNPPARDVISMEEVDQHFGQLATIFLMFNRKLLGTNFFPAANEFVWFLSPDDTLTARWKNNFFVWDGKDWNLDPECIPKPDPRADTNESLRCDVENVVELLHSITRLSIEDGELEVWFDDSEEPFTAVEFARLLYKRSFRVDG